MPGLASPTTRVHASFLAAVAEFQAEGRGGPADDSMIGRDIEVHASSWADPQVFSDHVDRLRDETLEETPRPAGYVPSTTL